MMEIRYQTEIPKETRLMTTDIPVGTVFWGRLDRDHNEDLFLKCFGLIVSLDNPRQTWAGRFPVEEYMPVKAHVVVEGPV